MDFPALLPILGEPGDSISVFSVCSLGIAGGAGPTPSTRNSDTNGALFTPFRLSEPRTVYKLACGTGTGTTGNFDLGIYDAIGTRMVSTGSTAKTTASSERIVDVTDTLLLPGLYYLAFAADGATPYVGWDNGTSRQKMLGCRQMASAFPLPATATFATCVAGDQFVVAAYLRPE